VREHFAALGRLGACPIHRRSFAPVRVALGLPLEPPPPEVAGLAMDSVAGDAHDA
jgi:ribonuclease HII